MENEFFTLNDKNLKTYFSKKLKVNETELKIQIKLYARYDVLSIILLFAIFFAV